MLPIQGRGFDPWLGKIPHVEHPKQKTKKALWVGGKEHYESYNHTRYLANTIFVC